MFNFPELGVLIVRTLHDKGPLTKENFLAALRQQVEPIAGVERSDIADVVTLTLPQELAILPCIRKEGELYAFDPAAPDYTLSKYLNQQLAKKLGPFATYVSTARQFQQESAFRQVA